MTCEDFLSQLYTLIEERKSANPEESYTASLFAKGKPKIAQKVGEEAVEVLLAAMGGGRQDVIFESSDLLYHLMVLWASQGITLQDVIEEMKRRQGTSGFILKGLGGK